MLRLPAAARFLAVACAAVVGVLPAAARPDVLVESVVVSDAPDGPWVRVRASGPVAGVSVEQNGATVRVTLRGARLGARLQRGPAAGAVRAYHVEPVSGGVALVLDVEPGQQVETVSARGASEVVLRVVAPRRSAGWGGLRVPPSATVAPAPAPVVTSRPSRRTRPAATESAPIAIATPAALPAAPPPTVAPRTTSRRSPARRAPERVAATPSPPVPVVSAPASSSPAAGHWRLDTIVLDAGHGGRDLGASYDGIHEKDVALSVTRRLGQMLERELGVRVVYTRTDDRFVELRERGRIANREGGKLFVSIHANAATNRSAYGTETFFLAPHRSADAREVMERENGVISLESAPELYERYLNQGDILQQMAMSAYQEESQALAGLIETEFVGQRLRSRGVKQAGFLVLWAASMPAVLVEVGFLSNRTEAQRLASERGQEDAARAIFRGIAAHKARYERGMRVASGTW